MDARELIRALRLECADNGPGLTVRVFSEEGDVFDITGVSISEGNTLIIEVEPAE